MGFFFFWHIQVVVLRGAPSQQHVIMSVETDMLSSEQGDTGPPPKPSRPSSDPLDEVGAGGMVVGPPGSIDPLADTFPPPLPPSWALVRRHFALAFWNHTCNKR